MSTALTIGGWILGAIACAAVLWYFVIPWISPLYARYVEWVKKTASAQKD